MSDMLYIADHNPITFLKLVEDAVKDGLYANDSVASYPYLNGLNEITLYRQDKPKQRHELGELNSVYVTAYEPVPFLLDVQDAILQGFEVEDVSLSPMPLTARLSKPVPATLDITPVVADTPVVEKAPEAPAVAPKPAKRAKAKSKEA